jgi:hypothetical protein
MFAASATAGCGYQPEQKGAGPKGAFLERQPWQSKIQLRPAAFVLADFDIFDPIVGMWNVQFTAGGTTIDFGYSQWHSDGTEIMNSGGHAPATENFCLGVWAKTGFAAYKVNHFALSYDPATGTLAAYVNIREYVTLNHNGNSFTGTFTIDITPVSGPAPPQIAGTITGQRITVN